MVKNASENFLKFWPFDLLAFGLYGLAEILPVETGVHKKAAYKISSKLVHYWLIYNYFYISALAFY